MRAKDFLNALANGRRDVLQLLLNTLSRLGADYCVVDGLAVNAYAEPVVSLDLDIVITTDGLDSLCEAARTDFRIERFPHSINLTAADSDLRIQIQTDPRYQEFLGRAAAKDVLGYRMRVAALEDVLQGKLWAYADPQRRGSKRQKDLADILRLVEAHPRLAERLPSSLREGLQ